MAASAIDLDAEIEAARQNLAELDRLRELAAARLAELDRLRGSRIAAGAGSNAWPAASKLRLFRDLFRGREDVFAGPLGEPRPQSIWLLTAVRERVATRRLR